MTEENMENLDSSTQDDSGVTIEEETASDEAVDERLAKLEENYENQKIRAQKAEEKNKELESQLKSLTKDDTPEPAKEETPEPAQPISQLSREEAILFSKGLEAEEVEYISKVAKVEDIGLLEAHESPLYKTWSQERAKKAESESAELETSKGSPRKSKQVDVSSPNLTPEQHEALWKKTIQG